MTQPDRQGPGRRQEDKDCAAHEDRLDSMERKQSWQKGATYVATAVLGVGMALIGWTGNALYTKVSSIESMLNQGAITASVLATKYESLEMRVKAIEDRHTYEQQNNGRR